MWIRNMFFIVLAAMLSMASVADEGDSVTVEFAEPDRYLDAGDHRPDHERNLARIEEFLVTEIGACLEAGERVDVRVLNVDLAGRFDWWHTPDGVRVMHETDWPRLKLEFTRDNAAGERIDEGREWVSDMEYLQRSTRRHSTRGLVHEQRMIRDWARKQFC